eukprot:3883946-Amphidinium_carterae.3
MPDPRDERAWLAGSNDVRVVEVGWTPFACAILRTLYKPNTTHVPTIWEMAWDLSMCGIGSKAAFDGVYQHPSSWIPPPSREIGLAISLPSGSLECPRWTGAVWLDRQGRSWQPTAWLDRSWRRQGPQCQQQGRSQQMSGVAGPIGVPGKHPADSKLTLTKGRDKRPLQRAQPLAASVAQHARTPLAAVATIPTVPLAGPAAHREQDSGYASSNYSAEDWRTWKAQQRWRDWSWGSGAHTWGDRSSHWDVQEAAPATWPGNQWSSYGEPALHNAWEGAETSQWQQDAWPQEQTWWQQQQTAKLWQHYQGSSDRARGASSRAQTQGGHKRHKGTRPTSHAPRANMDGPGTMCRPDPLEPRTGVTGCAKERRRSLGSHRTNPQLGAQLARCADCGKCGRNPHHRATGENCCLGSQQQTLPLGWPEEANADNTAGQRESD